MDGISAGVVVIALLTFVAYALQYPGIFEDAFIFYRYADNLAEGNGLVFNPGEAVEGYTSFTWVVGLALFRAFTDDLHLVAPWLSLLGGIAAVWLAFRLARLMVPDRPRLAAAAVWLIALNGSLAMYARSGMGTTLFTVLVSLSLLHACRDEGAPLGSDIRFALLLTLTAMTRPEGVGFAGLCLLGAMTVRGWRRGFRVGAMVAVVYGIYFAWRWSYFGYPLPNTYYAKQGGSLMLGVGYVEGYLYGHLGVLGLAGAAVAVWRKRPWAIPVVLVLGGGVLMAAVVGGDIFPLHRFLVPILPIAAACTAYLIWEISGPLRDRMRALVRAASVVTAASVILGAPHMGRTALIGDAHKGPDDWTKLQRNARITSKYERIAAWMDRTFPDDLTLAINAAGVIPYRTRLRTIDMLGLTDAHIAHRPLPKGRIALGHAKNDPAYVLGKRPDILIPGLPMVLDHPPGQRDLMRIWSRNLLPGDRAILKQRTFHRDYKLVVVQVDATGFTPFFLRRSRLRLLNGAGRAAGRGPR